MTDTNNSTEPVSKSQLKREARELFVLGRKISELPVATFNSLPLEPEIREAVEKARSMKSHGARKRQLGFLAKLMRNRDTEAIVQAMQDLELGAKQLTARHHRTEQWRDALIEGGDSSVSRLLETRHDADAQAIRQLIRNAQREAGKGKPPAAARKLFKLLRELDESEPLPPVDGNA